MSDMKYDAVVGSGIEIVTRVDIPEELIPADAKARAGASRAPSGTSQAARFPLPLLVAPIRTGWVHPNPSFLYLPFP